MLRYVIILCYTYVMLLSVVIMMIIAMLTSSIVIRMTVVSSFVVQDPPFLMPRAGGATYSHQSSTSDSYQGYYVDLLDELASHLGLKFELYLVPDSQYGRQLPNGKWNGIINQLLVGVRNKNLRGTGRTPY